MKKDKTQFASISADLNHALQTWNQVAEHVSTCNLEDSTSEKSFALEPLKNLNELQLLLKELQQKIKELAE